MSYLDQQDKSVSFVHLFYLYLALTICTLPHAEITVNTTVLSSRSSQIFFSLAKSSGLSAGSLKSVLNSPLSSIRVTKLSSFISAPYSSSLLIIGALRLTTIGAVSSYFWLVKMSTPTIVTLPIPRFSEGLLCIQSVTRQGKPLSIQYPPFLTQLAKRGFVSFGASCFSNSRWSDIQINIIQLDKLLRLQIADSSQILISRVDQDFHAKSSQIQFQLIFLF